MRNTVISNSFRSFAVLLKVPVVIIVKFGENNVLGRINIHKYQYVSIMGDGEVGTWFTLHLSFTIHKKGKNYKNTTILKSTSTSFSFNDFFPMVNNNSYIHASVQLFS